jgi:hypothetical protein
VIFYVNESLKHCYSTLTIGFYYLGFDTNFRRIVQLID